MNYIFKIVAVAKPHQRLLWFVSFLILINAGVGLLVPLLLKLIVDQITLQLTQNQGSASLLYWLLFASFGLNFASVVLTSWSNRLGDKVSARITLHLISKFYNQILRLSQSYFDSKLSGKILNQLTRGINSIGEFMGAATNFILPAILQTVLTIGLLTYYNRTIGFLSFIIFPVYIVISHYSTKRWAKFEVQKNRLEDNYKSRITEVIQNMKLVKTVNTQAHETKFVNSLIKKYVNIYDDQSVGYHWLNFARNTLLEVVLITIIILTFKDTFSQIISMGTMVLIIQLINQLRRPLFAMSFILERIQKANTGAQEYFEIVDLPTSEAPASIKPSILYQNPSLVLNNVSFTYEKTPVLKNISLSIKPGENIAIIGPSGAGKTTLVNLLLRLYEPESGEILLHNRPYNQLTHASLRAHFSYVFQDNELFSSTVYENVAYGQKLSKNAVIKALKDAYAYDFVMDFPQKLNTQIGERGVKLSGGQKQRLQIARALANPAPILILDEATSSLDAKSESLVQQALLSATKTKTVIIIAHRFSTLQHVDRIIVIDKGQIVDQGSPSELANRPGVFKDLLRYQIEGNQKLLQKYDIIS